MLASNKAVVASTSTTGTTDNPRNEMIKDCYEELLTLAKSIGKHWAVKTNKV